MIGPNCDFAPVSIWITVDLEMGNFSRHRILALPPLHFSVSRSSRAASTRPVFDWHDASPIYDSALYARLTIGCAVLHEVCKAADRRGLVGARQRRAMGGGLSSALHTRNVREPFRQFEAPADERTTAGETAAPVIRPRAIRRLTDRRASPPPDQMHSTPGGLSAVSPRSAASRLGAVLDPTRPGGHEARRLPIARRFNGRRRMASLFEPVTRPTSWFPPRRPTSKCAVSACE